MAPFRKYPQSGEINFENDDKEGTLADLKQTYGDQGADIMELDGVSIDLWDSKGFWFNVRASNTEPLLRLNAEAKDDKTLAELLAAIKPKLGTESAGH
ncbi:MAG: phosphomannomutase/phosphoglucomutase, partial [Planctomycetota bacterium]